MNSLHLFLIILAAIFVALFPFSRGAALKYARLAILLLVATVMLMPFAWLICSAFKNTDAMNRYSFLPPPSQISSTTLNFDNFRSLLKEQPTLSGPVSFWRYVTNSLFLASTMTVVSLFFSSLSGYALAKYRFRGRSAIMVYMLASMTIPGVVLLAPNFEVIWRLGWMDTYKALIIPGAVSAFGIFLFRQAMLGVPNELLEAARIDGCGEFRIYLTLIMPLVRPMSGGVLPDQLHGGMERVFGPQHISAIAKQIDPAGRPQSVYGNIRPAIWHFPGRNAGRHDSAGNIVLFATEGVYQRLNERCCKAMSFNVLFSIRWPFISGLNDGAVKQ